MSASSPGSACSNCGAALKPTASFCSACGTAIQRSLPACPQCGAELRPSARFCPACGAAVGLSARKPKPTARRSRKPVALGLVAAIAAVGGLAGFLLLRDGGEEGGGGGITPAGQAHESQLTITSAVSGPGPNGLEQRPGVRLVHPSGAIADVPSSEVVFSDYIDLREVDVPDFGPAWKAGGKAWTLVSNAGAVTEQPITLRLPAAGTADDTKVIAFTPAGWVPVPAEREGDELLVELVAIPSSWLLALARESDIPINKDLPPSEASAAAALYWTDREAWREQEAAWAAQQDLSVASIEAPLTVSLAPAAAPARSWLDNRKGLDWALRLLGAAGATMEKGGIVLPGGASNAVAWDQYRAAVIKLSSVRAEWVTKRAAWAEEAGTAGDWSALTFNDDQTMDQALETALALYAPWGVDLTTSLLKGGNLTGMDLRVLAPYGEAYFTDVPIPARTLDWLETAVAKVTTGTDGRVETRFLRLYSTKAIEDTSWIDYFKDWKTETFVRYLPVALWAGGVISGGPILIAVTALDQVLSWYQDAEEQGGDPYLYATIESAGIATEGVPLFLDATEAALRHNFAQAPIPGQLAGNRLGAVQFLYNAGLALAVAKTDWYMLKDVRSVTTGSQAYCIRGSCNWFYAQQIPPLQVIAGVRGPAKQAADAYPAIRTRVMAWNLQQFNTVSGAPNLHRDFTNGQSPEFGLTASRPQSIKDLFWEEYLPDRWPDGTVLTRPDSQAIRLAIPKDSLNAIAIDYELGPNPKFEDYGLVLRLETSDGKHNTFILAEEGPRTSSDKGDMVYVAVRLTRDGVDPDTGPGENVTEEYLGPVKAMDGGVLRTRLTGKLFAHTDESPRLTYDIDFSQAKGRVVRADPEDVESMKTHLFDTSATAPGNIYRLNKFEVTTWPDGSQNVLRLWQDGSLAPGTITNCEYAPSSCYLMFYTPRGAPVGTIEAALTGPDRKPENGIIVATQVDADSPDGQRWLQFQSDKFFGIYTVDPTTDRIADGTFTGGALRGRVTIRTLVDSDDPNAINVDGFPKGTVSLIFEGTAVK